jgi:uncharacterized protein YcbK (DUF882 family)
MMLERKRVDAVSATDTCMTRRRLLKFGATASLLASMPAWAKSAPRRALAFEHLHTGETLDVTYFANGAYDPRALSAINHVLRDFRTGQVYPIRPELLDQLYRVHAAIGSDAPFRVICGYRSPATNDFLHRTTNGVAEHSLHMDGMAIDVRLADTRTRRLRDVATSLKLGGVGYYASSDFVHLDVGRPRHW